MAFDQLNQLLLCTALKVFSWWENLFVDESFGTDWSNLRCIVDVGQTFAIAFILEDCYYLEVSF